MKFGSWLKQSQAHVPKPLILSNTSISVSPPLISYTTHYSSSPRNQHFTKFKMATISSSSSSSPLVFSHDHERLDLEAIRVLITLINQHLDELLINPKTRNSLKWKCTSQLEIRKMDFYEFSEQSILSNLYWGIENVEAAIKAKCSEEKNSRLKDSERMLQVPALLSEHGITAGIQNNYLICCSYFYLSIVRKLQRDEWQVAMHFLQALSVSPGLVHVELAPKLCRSIFLSCNTSESKVARSNHHTRGRLPFKKNTSERRELGARKSLERVSVADFVENESSEAMGSLARRYKAWLVYYQVMSYGETPHWHCGSQDVSSPDEKSQCFTNTKSGSTQSSNSYENGQSQQAHHNFEKEHPPKPRENITDETAEESLAFTEESMSFTDIPEFQDQRKALATLDQASWGDIRKSSYIKCLQDMLKEPQSDTSNSLDSCDSDVAEECESEEYADNSISSLRTLRMNADDPRPEISDKKQQAPCSTSNQECAVSMRQAPGHLMHKEANDINIAKCFSGRFSSSFSDFDLCKSERRDIESNIFWNCNIEEETTQGGLHPCDLQYIDHIRSTTLENYQFTEKDRQRSYVRRKKNSSCQKKLKEVCLRPQENSHIEQIGIVEKVISKLCFSEGLGRCEEDYKVDITTIYGMLTNKAGIKYSLLKDIILDQLLMAISTSKQEGVIRESVCILSTIISGNKAVIEDIKQKGLRLCDLASALKRNVYEAATLIYLINPSPAEIQTLELLPTLVDIVCNSNSYEGGPMSLQLTPPVASLMIIEVLVTAFDCATNNMHLTAISSPRVLSGLLNVPRNNNLEHFTSLAAILVRCMRYNSQCRKYISQFTPMPPFISLLISNHKRATFIALEFFHEMLRMPRSSAICLLHQIQRGGSINNLCVLMLLIQQSQPEYKLLAANLLLQLDMLEDSSGEIKYQEAAVEAVLESLTCEENSATQQLSAFILSNLGGTYAWTGEPYTIAWLVKKAGLTSLHHRNTIRNFDWSDQSLQDAGTDNWCSKIAQCIIKFGNPVFRALEKGLKSKTKRVSRDCLTAIAWLGCEIVKSSDDLRYSACEILLSTIEQYVHPGLELEERLLACLCIYNYASGRGMQKLICFSEGVLESLRRLSNVTWMAEELLKVADYFLPNKWRISCVHTQILEAGDSCSGAVSALVYYKGHLYSGYTSGSIKVWDIKGHTATLVLDMKEHRKAVTCFSLFEPGNCLLSGSSDKTIRIWQMVERKLECLDVITTKEPIQSIDTSGELIFAITHDHKMKVLDASRKFKDLCKNKHVKCIRVTHGKLYIGCMDSSIQELAIANDRQQEIKAPSKSWRMQNRPINSIALYKQWLYCASEIVEGSSIKEWRRNSKPQMSVVPEKRANVLAMSVVEDFIYVNCSSSTNNLQIWLRGTQQKVGRLSAGSKITSLLTANDMVLCGTETGRIKGWIPL